MGVKKPKIKWLRKRMKDCLECKLKNPGLIDWNIKEANSEEINGKINRERNLYFMWILNP